MASVSTFHAAAGTDDASWEDIMLPRGAREAPPVPRGPPLRYYLTTALTAPCRVLLFAPAAKDKAVLSAVFGECWPRDTRTGIPYPLKKTHRFPIAAPPYTERICYTSFYRAGYTTDNVVYAKEAVIAAFREYTPSPFLPTPLRPSLWAVLTVHLVMYRKHGNVRNYLARYYFQDQGKDGQGGRKKGPLPSADGLAKALDLAEAWHQSELGRYYQAGKCPPANVMFKGEEEVCEVTPHWEAAGRAASSNTNAVKNLAATQAVPGDNVDEGSSPEPPAKKAKQPAKPAA
eukprot:jgi/Tetstr1/424308/TSEL_014875.t1